MSSLDSGSYFESRAASERPGDARGFEAFARRLEWFLPQPIRSDSDARRRALLFVGSHLFGPFLGLAVLGYLYAIDPTAGVDLLVPAAATAAFWIFPPLLRLGSPFTVLALLSVETLAFVVLFLSYYYGGASSPFLSWLITMPLLAFFYLGEDRRLRWIVLGALAGDLLVFYLACRAAAPPSRVPLHSLTTVGVFSVFCAGVYVTAMALYYASIVASQSELAREATDHRRTAAELRIAKDAAEGANRAKTEFLATMSHELRTPLNAVIGFSEIMLNQVYGALGHEKYQGYALDIRDSGQHLLAIINDILDISKAESGAFELTEEALDCGETIRGTCRLLRPRAEKGGVSLGMALPEALPVLRGDARRVKQIFTNLIGNAIKFTPAGGRVDIEAAADRVRGLTVTIRDTGVGIAEGDLARVLQPFQQADASMSRRHEGTGLGLPLAVMMMHQHDGKLTIESEPGRGTSVRTIFPPERLVWAPPAGSPQMKRDAAQKPALPLLPSAPLSEVEPDGPPRVLVVEDDESARALFERMLTRGGFEVVTAIHGRDALTQLQARAVAAVVTDILMPEMDGVELMRLLQRERPSLPVIAISGVEEWREYLRVAHDLGARATLRKPVPAAQLVETVRRVLTTVG